MPAMPARSYASQESCQPGVMPVRSQASQESCRPGIMPARTHASPASVHSSQCVAVECCAGGSGWVGNLPIHLSVISA